MRALRCLVTATSLFLPAAIAAAEPRNWVDRYLSAHGHCASFTPMLSTRPLDKPIEDWTDGDLADLKAALERCDALPDSENGGGSANWTRPVYRSIAQSVRERRQIAAREEDAKVSALETAAQAEARRQRQIAADKLATSMRLANLQRAAKLQADERKEAEARTEAVANEENAAEHLAAEAEARAKAARVEAQARYEVEAAKKRTADAVEQTRNADVQARADRQAADQRFAVANPGATNPAPSGEKNLLPPLRGKDLAGLGVGSKPDTSRERIAMRQALTNEACVACKMLNELITATQAIVKDNGEIGAALINAGECFFIDEGTRVQVKAADCQSALKTGSDLECAPPSGQLQAAVLTTSWACRSSNIAGLR